ncbi:MAG TPA: PH domain-containing protein [Candidatus Paceibacterota bacterium]
MTRSLATFKLDPQEHVLLKFRKHWFVLLRDSIGTALSVFLPPLALTAAQWMGFDIFSAIPSSLITFVTFWWMLIVWLALSVIWTNYYLDLWLVTEKRLVSVDQTGLFYREVTTLSLATVQDVTVEQYGLVETFLNFGTVTVQNAGPTTNNMTIIGVADPGSIRDGILKRCDLQKQVGR